jgi:hypothetical protein
MGKEAFKLWWTWEGEFSAVDTLVAAGRRT